MRYYLVISIFLLAAEICSQTPINEPVSAEMEKYQKKILRKMKHLSCYNKKIEYSMIFIYHLKPKQNSLSSGSSLEIINSLELIYDNKKSRIPSTEAIIFSDSLEVIGYSDGLQVYCNFEYPTYKALLKHAFNNEVELLFRISGSNGMIYFSQKKEDIQVILVERNGLEVYTIEEFANCCWDTLGL